MRSWQSSSTEIPVNGYWSLHRGQIKMFSQEKKRRHKKRLFHSIRSGISWKLLANARSPRGNMNLLRGFIAETCIRNWLLDYYYQMHVYTDSFPHTNILYNTHIRWFPCLRSWFWYIFGDSKTRGKDYWRICPFRYHHFCAAEFRKLLWHQLN